MRARAGPPGHDLRVRSLLGSLAVHGLVLALLLAVRGSSAPPGNGVVTIDLVDLPAPPPPPPPPPPSAPAGGGSPGARHAAAHGAPRTRTISRDEAWAIAQARIEAPEGGGGGRGRGTGGGFGDGQGPGAGLRDLVPPPPPPPPAEAAGPSKARPARLVFPSRDVDVDDERLFVARITVDDEGTVVGAHLIKGFDRPRASLAADSIWRFRYAPALDDAGRPIRTTFEQPFTLGAQE